MTDNLTLYPTPGKLFYVFTLVRFVRFVYTSFVLCYDIR